MHNLQAIDFAAAAVDASGLSRYGVSRRMGRARSYVSVLLSRGSTPSLDVAARLADACGVQLRAVMPDGSTVRIVPSHDHEPPTA